MPQLIVSRCMGASLLSLVVLSFLSTLSSDVYGRQSLNFPNHLFEHSISDPSKAQKELGRDLSEVDPDSCQHRLQLGQALARETATAIEAYDTLKDYLSTCYSDLNSCQAFASMTGAVSAYSDKHIYLSYREFLKSVLYLNPSECYYCADVEALAGTYGAYINSETPDNDNAEVAILDFLINSGKCPSFQDYYATVRKSIRDQQISNYEDTVRDPIATPIDTTSPTLGSLGLGIVIQNGVAQAPVMSGQEILGLSASANPFRSSTDLSFELGELDVAQLEIFDLLGNAVWSSGRTAQGEGKHTFKVSLSDRVSGTLYVRLSTGMGDVRTLKLSRVR